MAAEDACLRVEKEISSRKSFHFDFHSEAFQVGLLCFVRFWCFCLIMSMNAHG